MGNLPFSEKKTKLETTHIELNRWILQQNRWGTAEIEQRAKVLFDMAGKIWLSPSDVGSE